MTDMDPALRALAAEAAVALRGHLEFLGALGVDGLPAPRVRRAAAPARETPAAPPTRPAAPAAPPPPAAAARPARSSGEAMPWERHLGATAAPTPAAAPPRRAPPPPAVPPTIPAALTAPPSAARAPAVPPPPAAGPPSFVMPQDVPTERGPAGLKVIREDLGDCKRCKLHAGRTNIVFGVGNPAAEICFVGEGPGADEDMQGEPFVGRAGQLLTQMIKAMGYAREDVYICNVVKCRPPNNRDPEPDEVAACGPFMVRQVRAVAPKVIVTLGKHAAHALLGVKTPITRLRGTWNTFDGIPLMPTFHPSFLLRDPSQKKFAWDDLKAVLTRLGRPVPAPRREG